MQVNSKYIIRELNSSEIELWDSWVSFQFGGNIFYKLGWLRAMEQNSGMELKLLSAWPLVENKFPLALLPFFVMKKWPLHAVFSPPPGCDTPYLGPLYNNESGINKNKLILPDIQSAMASYFHNQGVNFIKLRTSPEHMDGRGFIWEGFRALPQYEYELLISDPKAKLLQGFPGDTRTKIRRAQKYEELEFEFGGIESALPVFHMIRERFSEQGIEWQLKEPFIKSIFRDFHPSHIQAVLATFSGEPIGGMIFFKDNNKLVDWVGGMNPKKNISGLNELMHWKIIEWGQKNDCSTYNLGGANTPHLCKPKLKYSPELVIYSEVIKGKNLALFINNSARNPVIRNILHKIK